MHNYIDALIPLVAERKLVTDDIITHHLPLAEVDKGYEILNRKKDHCVKVAMHP